MGRKYQIQTSWVRIPNTGNDDDNNNKKADTTVQEAANFVQSETSSASLLRLFFLILNLLLSYILLSLSLDILMKGVAQNKCNAMPLILLIPEFFTLTMMMMSIQSIIFMVSFFPINNI